MILSATLCALAAAPSPYALEPVAVAEGVYVFEGRQEHFSRENGGNIVNTAFVVGETGVVVVDTGPSKLYGEAMRRAIGTVTDLPVARIYLTHAHPDHFLGNQAFPGIPVFALATTATRIEEQGEDLAENLYGMLGGWMRGTSALAPTDVAEPGAVEVGGRALRVLTFSGHTDGDLVVVDVATGTWITGDLVFLDRAPTTPDADLSAWHAALNALEQAAPGRVVPGHGPVHSGKRGIEQTRAYLRWLEQTLGAHARAGDDMMDAFEVKSPPAWVEKLHVFGDEHARSVVHLFPGIEAATLRDLPPLPKPSKRKPPEPSGS